MKVDTISTIAIAAGSFLLGGSLGLALSSDCHSCDRTTYKEPWWEAEEVTDNDDTSESLIAVNDDISPDEEFEEYEKKTLIYTQRTFGGGDTDGDDSGIEPYVVSRDSFENEYLDFHKESLVYFTKDKVLVDDRDEVIDDIKSVLGSEALDSFGEGSEDDDIVFVRNMRIQCDFEVVREHMSYKENVLGISEKETEEYLEARKFFNLDESEDQEE